MKLTIPNIDILEDEGFSSEKDIFLRKDFGERLANLVEHSEENLVIALDAKWGEGKSTFIKMWRGYIKHQRESKIKSIYFDAFANDYQKEPFLALAAEIFELIRGKSKKRKDEFKRKAGNAVKSMARGAIKIGVRSLSGGVLDGSFVDSAEKDISKLLADQIDAIVSDKLQNTASDKLAITQFKDYLGEFSTEEGNGNPIVFIIDELDRCRPDFALELIEQIKHLFSVQGIVFLLVVNRAQLQESIKSRYGRKVEANVYLQKFVNIWLNLPRKSELNRDHGVQYAKHTLNLMLNEDEGFSNTDAINLLYELVECTKPSFREIEQILSYLALMENMSNGQNLYPGYQMVFAFICFLKVVKTELINKIVHDDIDAETLFKEAGIASISHETSHYQIEYLVELVSYNLADDDTKKTMEKERDAVAHLFGRHVQKDVMKNVCGWLSEMKLN